MKTLTIRDMALQTGVQVTTGYDLDFDIPVLSGPQRQGDVIVLPAPRSAAATTPVPSSGTAVVRGEAGGNTHAIYADGEGVFCDVVDITTDLTVARLTVNEGLAAYLGHPEHAFAGIGPGMYVIRRQREQADQIRVVAD